MNDIHNRFVASVASPQSQEIIGLTYQGWASRIRWCEEHIVDGWWYRHEGVFEFVDEADRAMFILRWDIQVINSS